MIHKPLSGVKFDHAHKTVSHIGENILSDDILNAMDLEKMQRECLKGTEYFTAEMAGMGLTDGVIKLTTGKVSVSIWVIHECTDKTIRMSDSSTGV